MIELPIYVIYLDPLGKPRVRSFISASSLSRIRCSRYAHNMERDTKNAKVQHMNDLEYDGPHSVGHKYLELGGCGSK